MTTENIALLTKKRTFLESQLILAVDANQIFALQEQIEDITKKLTLHSFITKKTELESQIKEVKDNTAKPALELQLQDLNILLEEYERGNTPDSTSGIEPFIPLESNIMKSNIMKRLNDLEEMVKKLLENNISLPPHHQQTNSQKIFFAYSPITEHNGRKLSPLNPADEYDSIKTTFSEAKNAKFYLENICTITNENFLDTIEANNPYILHISTHGDNLNGEYQMYLKNEKDANSTSIDIDNFRERMNLLKEVCPNLKILVLSWCHSLGHARWIKGMFDAVIFTQQQVTEEVCKQYFSQFYKEIFKEKIPIKAHEKAIIIHPHLKVYFDIFV